MCDRVGGAGRGLPGDGPAYVGQCRDRTFVELGSRVRRTGTGQCAQTGVAGRVRKQRQRGLLAGPDQLEELVWLGAGLLR